MINQTCVQLVFSSSKLLSIIFSYLRYDLLKECRSVSKFWKFEATKILREKTRVCVNNANLEVMLYATTILGNSLHVRWSPFNPVGMRTLLQKYSRYIHTFSWFMENSDILEFKNDLRDNIEYWELNNVQFPKVTEIYFILSCSEYNRSDTLSLVSTILCKCSSLKSIRVETLDSTFKISNILKIIDAEKFQHLSEIHLGKNVKLSPEDFSRILRWKPVIASFIWEGKRCIDEIDGYNIILDDSWLKSLKNFQISSPRLLSIPLKPFPLTRLSVQNLKFNLAAPLTNQFPLLQELAFSFQTDFKWETWTTIHMKKHQQLKSLKWLDRENFHYEAKQCFSRLFSKAPNLTQLSCPADDQFIGEICRGVPQLKTLELNGKCTDSGITGIHPIYFSTIKIKLRSGQFQIRTMDDINPYRTGPSICYLSKLEEISFLHTNITDASIFLAVSLMHNLSKVNVTGVSKNAIMQLLRQTNIKELGVPQPLEGNIKYEDIEMFQRKTPQIKIVVGWDSTSLL